MKNKFWEPLPSPLNIAILTGKWGKSGLIFLLESTLTKSDIIRMYYYKILRGLLSHKNNRIPMKKEFRGPPWPLEGHYLGVLGFIFK